MIGDRKFVCCLWFVIAFTEVACWTVDLEEVRQFLDKQKEEEDYQQLHYHNYYDESDEYDSFAEVTQAQAHRGHNYAHQYGYDGYMEKKVHSYVHKGAQYLDGLKLALENYKQLMENCSAYNFTEFDNLNASLLPDVRWNETADVWNWGWAQGERKVEWPQILNITAQNNAQNATAGATITPMQGATLGIPPGAILHAPPRPSSGSPGRGASPGGPQSPTHVATQRASQNLAETTSKAQAQRAKCEKATREREQVRRLADLALFTARQLQSWANHEKLHDKSSSHAKEERALITRLAYFLDKLAELTGYTPDIKIFSKQNDRTTTTTTASPMSVAMSEELRQLLLTCLRQQASSSTDAATERCRAPLLLPPYLRRMFNTTQASTTPTPLPRSSALTTTPPPLRIDPELRQARVLDNYFLSNEWTQQPARSKRKRSLNEPLMKMVEYYTKHKAWTGSNKLQVDKQQLNVENDLTKPNSEDRSDFVKRKLIFSFLYPYKNNRSFRRPKIPNLKHGDKLNKFFEKLRKTDTSSSAIVRKVNIPRKLKSIRKRSVIIEQSEDPMRDISYYVKNKPGTNVRPSVADAVRVRAALERIFNIGNIEVVRRYGSNYNPLIPSPFYFGVIKTISDI